MNNNINQKQQDYLNHINNAKNIEVSNRDLLF